MRCTECGREITPGKRGPKPLTCGARCRQKRHRRIIASPFPESMTQTARWARADKKKPITPTGRPASSTDNSTWSRYRDVQQGAGDGYGVMLGGGLGCYDLDHCIDDGVVASWAVEFIGEIPEEIVFMERSVSGTGIHVFVEADETPGYRRGKVERYSRGRFIRVTGVRLEV